MMPLYSREIEAQARLERKIEKIRFAKKCGVVVYGMIILTVMIVALIKIDTVCKLQADTLNRIEQMQTRQEELEEQGEALAAEGTLEGNGGTLFTLSDSDRELVERVVAAEARGDSAEGMMAVAQVIYDRAELWNMTPAEVVTAYGQFAEPYQGEISDEVKAAVSNVFDYGFRVSEEPITHFYSGSNEPYWTEGKVNRGDLGSRGHQFFY